MGTIVNLIVQNKPNWDELITALQCITLEKCFVLTVSSYHKSEWKGNKQLFIVYFIFNGTTIILLVTGYVTCQYDNDKACGVLCKL